MELLIPRRGREGGGRDDFAEVRAGDGGGNGQGGVLTFAELLRPCDGGGGGGGVAVGLHAFAELSNPGGGGGGGRGGAIYDFIEFPRPTTE